MDFIHKFIPSEQHSTKDTPTLVLLHGTGGNEDDLIPLGQFLAPEANLLGIRGNVLEGGMSRFFRRLSEGVFDEEDLILRTHELAQFLRESIAQYSLNPTQLIAVGYSNGANIAASLMLLEPSSLSKAILLRAMVPLVPESLPDLSGRDVLMQCGTQDRLIPAKNSQRLADILTSTGAAVTLNWQETGHNLTNTEFRTVQTWLNQHMTS